jgi:hypothetical protein
MSSVNQMRPLRPAQRDGIVMIFAGALLLVPLQWLLTGGLLFPRNYLYLLPFVALLGAFLLWQRAGMRGVLLVLAFVLILQVPSVKSPTVSSQVDDVIAHLDEVPPNAALLIGCCLDEPVRYYATGSAAFDARGKTEWIVAPGITDLAWLLRQNGIALDECQPMPPWGSVAVYDCKGGVSR